MEDRATQKPRGRKIETVVPANTKIWKASKRVSRLPREGEREKDGERKRYGEKERRRGRDLIKI